MSDASAPREDWAGYLRRMTKRPGWSVARLSRESGIHRGTIFKWLSGSAGANISSVRAIAIALGDDPTNALRAAGTDGAVTETERDEELDLILAAPVDDATRQRMVELLFERRERDRQQRMADFQQMIDIAKQAG